MNKLHKQQNKPEHIHVFIGYDDREPNEWKVAKESILDHAIHPVSVYPLKHRTLRDIGLFNREWKVTPNGTYQDIKDGKPFSTQFAFTRFLVPAYATYLGLSSWDLAVFVDSDFVFTQDIYKLYDEIALGDKPLWVVKHNYTPSHVVKMDNQIQTQYQKKNWSSFMVFDLSFNDIGPSCNDVNNQTGNWLHSFQWLKDELIGSLHEGWNFIPNHSEERVSPEEIKAIHYTEGTPLMVPGCKLSGPFHHYQRRVVKKEMFNN